MFVRAISAIIGILLLILVGFFFKAPGLVAVCSVVSLIACYEYAKMFAPHHMKDKASFLLLSFSLHLLFGYWTQSFFLIISFYFIIVFRFLFQRKLSVDERLTNINLWTSGVLYCGLLTGVIVLGVNTFQIKYFIGILIASFSTDTLAYLGGRAFGKRALASKISPNKTVEGAFIGLIGGSVPTVFFLNSLNHSSPLVIIIIVSFLASFFSQVGDLYESMMKRAFGIKDSGSILPGHGGALDRIDGLLFSAPILFLWMSLYINN